MAKKPSFFEKLTGASWADEEEKKKVGSAGSAGLDKSKKKEKKKAKAVAVKGKSAPAQPGDRPAKQGGKDKDWLSESEGQLTIDVYQTPKEVVIKSTIAGVDPRDIDISMNNDMITIKGTRQKDEEIKEEDYYYQECYWGPFSRSIILPVDVEADQVTAGMKNGILTVRLPKIERAQTKKIAIQAE